MVDRVGAFFQERTVRRIVAVSLFITLLILFRQLLLLLVFFVSFERLIGWPSEWLSRKTRLGRKAAVGLVALGILAVVGGLATVGVGRTIHAVTALKATLPEHIAHLRETSIFQKLKEHLEDADTLVENAKHYAASAAGYLAALGHILLYAIIGLVLAVVFLLERDELAEFAHGVPPESLVGTLLRWFHHVADAMLVTVQFQLVVAACNAVLTLPVILFVIGAQHAAALVVMIFLSGLVPVVGNFMAGGVLTFLAYQSHGWLGVSLFSALTFVLHKIESYYLNPRLAARHVKLPGFVLIVSLLAWEHLLGFKGLFISFPFLFVAQRIRAELRQSDAPASAPTLTAVS
jgi:predicted PurR-regulated permease PerM